jgi:hypothetical protein
MFLITSYAWVKYLEANPEVKAAQQAKIMTVEQSAAWGQAVKTAGTANPANLVLAA